MMGLPAGVFCLPSSLPQSSRSNVVLVFLFSISLSLIWMPLSTVAYTLSLICNPRLILIRLHCGVGFRFILFTVQSMKCTAGEVLPLANFYEQPLGRNSCPYQSVTSSKFQGHAKQANHQHYMIRKDTLRNIRSTATLTNP